jgi:hypothetical protein
MPVSINGTNINYLSGPISATILIPINKYKPVLFLIGEYHKEIEKGCDTNFTSMQELLQMLNEFALKYETHVYVEEFAKSDISNFIKNNSSCDDIKNKIKTNTPEHEGCLKIFHDNIHHCFYNDYKEKCSEDFKNSCSYSNIIWQYSDIRNIDELNNLRSLSKFIKEILSCLADTTHYNVNFLVQYTYDMYKAQKVPIRDETKDHKANVRMEQTIRQILRSCLAYKKSKMYSPEDFLNTLNNNNKPYYDKHITNVSNTHIFEQLNDNEKKEIEKISNRANYDYGKNFFVENFKININSFIKKYKPTIGIIDTYLNLLNADMQFINDYFEMPIIKEQLKNISMTEDEKIKLKNDMLQLLSIVNDFKYFVNDDVHTQIKNFIITTFKMLKSYINAENKQIILENFYDEVKRDFGDDLIVTMVKLSDGDNNLDVEYFTKRLSVLTDMYFLLRTLITSSCPKLIVSLIGTNHINAQTIYYINSNEYTVHRFDNLKDEKDQCTNLTVNYDNIEVNINLDDEVSQIKNYCKQVEQFEETKEEPINNNVNTTAIPDQQPTENMEGGKFINEYKKYKKNKKNIKSHKNAKVIKRDTQKSCKNKVASNKTFKYSII